MWQIKNGILHKNGKPIYAVGLSYYPSYRSDIVAGTTEVTLSGLPKEGCKIEVYMTDEAYDEKLERVIECNEETCVLPVRLVDEQIRLIKIGEK